jgi:hypothetical protein
MIILDPKKAVEARSWPFEEAKKVLNRYKHSVPEKGYVLFETGYGKYVELQWSVMPFLS